MSSILPASSAICTSGSALMLQRVIEDEHFAEHRSGLGGGERRVVIEITLLTAEAAMQTVAELMGDGHDVTQVMSS